MSSITEKPIIDIESLLAGNISVRSKERPRSRRFGRIATLAEMFGDAVAAVLGIYGAYVIYHFAGLGRRIEYPLSWVCLAAMLFAGLLVLMLDRNGAYSPGNGLLQIKETERVIRVSIQTFLVVSPVTIFAAHVISRWVVVLALFLVPAAVICQKQLLFMLIRSLHLRGFGVQRVLIYGAGLPGKRVFSALVRSPKLGLDPVAMIDDYGSNAGEKIYAFGYSRERCIRVSSGPLDAETIRKFGADVVILAIPDLDRERYIELLATTLQSGADVCIWANRDITPDLFLNYADVDGILLAYLDGPNTNSVYDIAKRAFDAFTALAILIVGAPLLATIALAIRLDSEGPVIFKQRRIGKNGKPFEMLKFRSMYVHASRYDFSPEKSADPRITRVGRFLRKTSLDELLQLINVVKGEMSLVGPRPEMPFIVAQYGPRERQRLCVLPGITGIWQLSADRAFQIHENLQYDLYYIRNRGFFMDLAILLHTAIFAMKGI